MIDYGYGVALAPLTDDGAAAAMLTRNRPEIRKWCRQNTVRTQDEAVEWHNNEEPKRFFTVCNSEYGKFGAAGLTSIDQINQRAEFSLFIDIYAQGKGLGEGALKTLLRHGFEDWNLNCIWGETFDGNPAMHMFEKLGFVKEGTRRQFYFKGGKWIDSHLISLLRSEWKPW